MLSFAVHQRYIKELAAANIGELKEAAQTHVFLLAKEIAGVFDEARPDEIWLGGLKMYSMNLLAASSGMRQSECKALGDILDHFIPVQHSWGPHGQIPLKFNATREVPIPTKTWKYLMMTIKESQYKEPEDLVFWGTSRKLPAKSHMILRSLRRPLYSAGSLQGSRKNATLSFTAGGTDSIRFSAERFPTINSSESLATRLFA